jgi:hypothetical protein
MKESTMHTAPPGGITPPTPGLEHEEPEVMVEEYDIPTEDGSESEPADRSRD